MNLLPSCNFWRDRSTAHGLVWGLTAVVGTLLSGCASSDFDETVRDNGVVAASGEVGYLALRPGDCVLLPEADVTTFNVLPCSEPHEAEAFYVGNLRSGDEEFPGQTAVWEAAVEKCTERFATYVGVAWEASVLNFEVVQPSEETWDDGGRFICLLTPIETDTLTGSMKDAGI